MTQTISPRINTWLFPLLLSPLVGCSTTGPQGMAQPDAARIYDDVAWLADDAREGRRAGTPGERASADYIGARFAELGLEPAGEDGWGQSFEVDLPPRDGGGSFLKWDGGAVSTGAGNQVTPLFCSSTGGAEGDLVFAGYGISRDDLHWNDFANIDLTGKVAFIVRGTPPRPGGVETEEVGTLDDTQLNARASSWGNSAGIFHKVMEAKRNGAIAVVLAQDPLRPGEGPLSFDAGGTAITGIPAIMLSDGASRRLYDPKWLSRPAKRLDDPLAKVRLNADIVREKAMATNVLARLRGKHADRTVVIGAHFDHLGRGGTGSLANGKIGEIHNGADDNASGTAAVLEIARCLVSGPMPEGDVVFALWSAEELGLLGSEYWAKQPTFALDTIVANLNLDMVGRANDGDLQVLGAGTTEGFAGWLKEADERSELKLVVSKSGQGLGGSDHQTFLRREIPALHFFSGVHIDYHRPSDDTESFEAEGAAWVSSLVIDLLGNMQAAGELAYTEPEKEEGNPRIKARFSVWFGSVPEYSYEGSGLLLAGTSPGSPAEKAGLLAGDVLIGMGDMKIETIYDFMYTLQSHKPGDVIRTTYLRDGKEETVAVTLNTRAVR